VTRLHDSKGNSYLVEATQKVIARRPRTRFVIFGEGPLRPELEAQARALGLGDRFTFNGFARDVARVVSAFDVSVFPSLWEGTPLTVFEALAMGKPIVATDVDGLVDVLTHDRDAVIVPKRDAEALSAGLLRLIDSPEDRARLSAHARVTGQQYDITAFVRKMERLYDVLHEVSRKTRRQGVLQADLSFLNGGACPEPSRGTRA
jgi:glycosyltransferase involved in cell wall biosynthesis